MLAPVWAGSRDVLLISFEKLDRSFVFLGGGKRRECSQVLAGSAGGLFSGIQAILSGGEFSDHGKAPFCGLNITIMPCSSERGIKIA